MRWDSIRLDEETGPDAAGPVTPALFGRDAVTRTFDTPGFRGMTFYEVHAKSIINRVPEVSRVPFRWTINPYRGCSHSCSYCLVGQTPILMGDGRTRQLAEVRSGDLVYGTIREGNYGRYVITEVLAHWSTVKPAYRVTLADGTTLISSGDHRFLTAARGWKYVTGAEQGPLQRPHLTLNNKLMGVGAFAEPPKHTADYRRGYLCGMIRGDGHLGVYRYAKPAGKPYDHRQFRLALIDQEALDRTRGYLSSVGIACTAFTFTQATEKRRRVEAIRCSGRELIGAIQWLIAWPNEPTAEWRKGFLAGIFDAEGNHGDCIRIANCDREIINWTVSSLESLGFRLVIEETGRPNGLANVRLLGGLPAVLRFFHTTDPAITRKRSIAGTAIKCDADLRVVSIKPLGLDLEMYDITTGTGDFIADGVVSHNCFARNTHTYLDMDAGEDFNNRIVVKVNAPELARRELAAARWQGEHVAMGTNVDCYQRAEGRYQLMPGIISALRDAANPFSILTKGTLILRDLDLLSEAADVTDVGLNVSVGFVDKDLSRLVEPGTPGPERRLGVCAALTQAGLPCGVLMGPVLPFLTDSPAQLEATVRLAADAGASHVSPIVLHLRPGAREWFLRWLREAHPELIQRYRELYGRGAYAPRAYQQRITEQVAEFAARYRVGHASPRRARQIRPQAAQPADPPASVQLSLL
ncbi:MAG: intein-containing Rv2578c family radical SAM protein [Actinobacteria bacterium]|nr:intein-containing Rv2578c family radical SAM protein [Actinomycetota bacterium]